MKKRYGLLAIVGLVLAVWMAGCTTPKERVKEDIEIKGKVIDQQMIVK